MGLDIDWSTLGDPFLSILIDNSKGFEYRTVLDR